MTATAIALGATIYWVASIQISGIHSTGISDADLIRERVPIHLVSPDWVSGDLFERLKVETLARMGFGVLAWAVAMAFILRRLLRAKRKPLRL